jgi:hypothetical protein
MPQTRNELDLNVLACHWIGFSQRSLEALRTIGRHMGILLTTYEANGGTMCKGCQVGQGVQVVIEVLSRGVLLILLPRFTRDDALKIH